ncbi:MAG: hypothetical protein ACTSRS_16340 [Candidatus Helarchaeota archaeon]
MDILISNFLDSIIVFKYNGVINGIMTNLRITLPDELNKEFRSLIASKYGYSKGALSSATQYAILKWIIDNGKEPWLYIDSNMTLDIHETLVLPFLDVVVKSVAPKIIYISFEVSPEERALLSKLFTDYELDDEYTLFKLQQDAFLHTFQQLNQFLGIINKSSLLIELNNITIISGGNGCLCISGEITPRDYNQIIMNFLKELHIELNSNLNDFRQYSLILLNQNSKLIELGEKR